MSYITTLHLAYSEAPRAMAAPALSVSPGLLHAFACLYAALPSTADFEAFCTQVGLRGGVYRVHKHARHGGVSRRGRGRQPIRQAAASTANVFQPAQAKMTSTSTISPSKITGWFRDLFRTHTRLHPWAYVLLTRPKPCFRGWLLTNPPIHQETTKRPTAPRSSRAVQQQPGDGAQSTARCAAASTARACKCIKIAYPMSHIRLPHVN
jgi:hypothetical protein